MSNEVFAYSTSTMSHMENIEKEIKLFINERLYKNKMISREVYEKAKLRIVNQ